MTVRTRVTWAAVPLLLLLTACGAPVGTDDPAPAETSPSAPPSSPVPASASTRPSASPISAELPDLVGKGLQYAQDTAQAAGFALLTSHDSSGRERLQVSDRNWKVCFQSPPPGPADPKTTVDFGVVKLDEACPEKDAAPASSPATAPATMPRLVGKSLRAAEEALGLNASLTVRDATGEDRAVLVSTNWRICAQDPAPGAPYAGVPVTLDVVKYGEDC